jgi:hypothetical protein
MSNTLLSEAMQLSVSTAEEERNYNAHREFVATPAANSPPPSLGAGIYRVIDGSLRRVLPGAPPAAEHVPERLPPIPQR